MSKNLEYREEHELSEVPKCCWDCKWMIKDYYYYENAYNFYCGVYLILPVKRQTCCRKELKKD